MKKLALLTLAALICGGMLSACGDDTAAPPEGQSLDDPTGGKPIPGMGAPAKGTVPQADKATESK